MNKGLLTIAQSKALRGLAILGIILHNYCHFLGFAVKENEYTFTAEKPRAFFEQLFSPDGDLFVHFFSFLGHYGVPVFLFISGFGLVFKYEQSMETRVRPLPFIGFHYLKLLRLMILGFVGFVVVCYLHPKGYHGYNVSRVVAQLLMYINLLPDPDHIIKPGPYWFFGLMMQLYIVFRLVIYRRSSWFTVALIAVCWAAQAVFCPESDLGGETLNRIRYNFIGGMLPFGMGVLYARHGKVLSQGAYASILVVSLLAIGVGSLWFQSWLWVPLFVVSGSLATVKLLPQWALSSFVWVGAVSSALFVVHPITREIIIPYFRHSHIYVGIAVYVAASFLLAWLFKLLFRYIPKPQLHS